MAGRGRVNPYVDGVDQSTADQKTARRGGRMVDIALRQLRLVKHQQSMLDYWIKPAKAGSIPIEDVSKAIGLLSDVSTQVEKLTRTVRDCEEYERKKMGGLTDAEIDQVIAVQIARVAERVPKDKRKRIVELWFGTEVAETLCR